MDTVTARLRRLTSRRRRDERGAVALIAALTSLLLVLVTSFVIDIGMQRVVRRDMQALADVVAFDMSRQLDGRRASVILASNTWSTALSNSLSRNTSNLGSKPVVTAEVGMVDDAGAFVAYTGTDIPTAVRVTAKGAVDFSIPIVSRSGGATRTAVAVQRKQACIRLGSYAAAVQSGNGTLLGELLGSRGVNLTAAGYQGLANANVTAGALATALGLGSPEQLTTATVTYGALVSATATALNQSGQTQAAAYLAGLSTTLGAQTNQQVNVGSLIGVAAGSGSALATNLNALNLIAGGVFVSNGSNFIGIPQLTTNLSPLANVTSSLSLIEGPRAKCGYRGETSVETSQANLAISGTIGSTPIVDAPLGLVSVSAGTPAGKPVTLQVDLAKSRGTLDDVTCPSTANNASGTQTDTGFGATVGVTSGATAITLTVPLRISGQISLLGIGLVNFSLETTFTVRNDMGSRSNSVQVKIPPSSFDTPYSSGTNKLALSSISTTHTVASYTATTLLGLSTTLNLSTQNSIIDDLFNTVVNPLVSRLNTRIVTPLGDTLGVGLGGADVFILGPRLVCDSPALRG